MEEGLMILFLQSYTKKSFFKQNFTFVFDRYVGWLGFSIQQGDKKNKIDFKTVKSQ